LGTIRCAIGLQPRHRRTKIHQTLILNLLCLPRACPVGDLDVLIFTSWSGKSVFEAYLARTVPLRLMFSDTTTRISPRFKLEFPRVVGIWIVSIVVVVVLP
jgi:hypothetical protein